MSSLNFNNVCFFYLKGVCAFGSRCHKLHVKPAQEIINNSDDGTSSARQSSKSLQLPEPANPEVISNDRILELKRGIDNSLFGRTELEDSCLEASSELSHCNGSLSASKTSCIKSLHENSNQICTALFDVAPSIEKRGTYSPFDNNQLESSLKKSSSGRLDTSENSPGSCFQAVPPDYRPSVIDKLSEMQIGSHPFLYGKNDESNNGSTKEKIMAGRPFEFSSQSPQSLSTGGYNISSGDIIAKYAYEYQSQAKDDYFRAAPNHSEAEFYYQEERKCENMNQRPQECRKIIFEKDGKKRNQEKTLEEKMRNAYALFHENKSDEAIKAFTEIVKDKSAVMYRQEALFGRCKSQVLKRNLTLALVDISKALAEPNEDMKYIEITHKDELLIEMASIQLKFGMSGKAKEVLTQLSILTTELTNQIDNYEKNLSDIEKLLTQYWPPKAYKIRHKRGLRHFAGLILNFTKDTALKSLEKVTACKNIAPESRALKFLELECHMRSNDKTKAGAVLSRLDAMKLTPTEKQTLEVLRLIYKYTFTFDWNSFPGSLISMKTPIFHLMLDFDKALHAVTGPLPIRWTDLLRGPLPCLCSLERENATKDVGFSIDKHVLKVLNSGVTNPNVIDRLLALVDASEKTISTCSLIETEENTQIGNQGRVRRLTI